MNGGRGNTYSNVALWLFLLRNYSRDAVKVSYSEALKKKGPKSRARLFQYAAVININDRWVKSKGKFSDDNRLFDNYSRQRHTDIESVISTCDPEIIVTCGKVVLRCLRKFESNIQKIDTYGTIPVKAYTYEINGVVRLLISMPHPNAHIRQHTMYNELLKLIESINIK